MGYEAVHKREFNTYMQGACDRPTFERYEEIVKRIVSFYQLKKYAYDDAFKLYEAVEDGKWEMVCGTDFPWRPFFNVAIYVMRQREDFVGGPKWGPDLGGVMYGINSTRGTENADFFWRQAELWQEKNVGCECYKQFVAWKARAQEQRRAAEVLEQKRRQAQAVREAEEKRKEEQRQHEADARRSMEEVVRAIQRACTDRRPIVEFNWNETSHSVELPTYVWESGAMLVVADYMLKTIGTPEAIKMAAFLYEAVIGRKA